MEAFGRSGDVLIAISASGNSRNVSRAVLMASALRMKTIGWTGRSGGKLKNTVDLCLCVPSQETSRIHEAHLVLWARNRGSGRHGDFPAVTTVALSMIVRDAGAYLAACLASVRGVVDEVVVADTGSTDDTVEIGLNMGAQVIPVRWTDDFAAARNRAHGSRAQ